MQHTPEESWRTHRPNVTPPPKKKTLKKRNPTEMRIFIKVIQNLIKARSDCNI